MRILVVEDELLIAEKLADALRESGYLPEIERDGEQAWFMGSTGNYAAIILDLGLPGIDGLTLIKRWRSEGINVPILILSARSSWSDRVDGIDTGADDFLVKPFQMQEVLARLRALIRRSSGNTQSRLEFGQLQIDLATRGVNLSGTPLSLTPLEFRLLQYLALHKDHVVPQTELAEALYAHDHERDANAIEAVISRLRRKLGGGYLKTKRGFGYYLEATQ
jgi:two-component system, OmpR family, response regulator